MRSSELMVTRIADRRWHALIGDLLVGRGEASPRPDGRLFLSIDSWQDDAFDRLATAMLSALPKPLYTVVDETDLELMSRWRRAGSTPRRREWEYRVPTDPVVTGLDSTSPPGIEIVNFGAAEIDSLRELDRTVRAEIEAAAGWQTMPAEVIAPPIDPANYVAAAQAGHYVGLCRVAQPTRLPRIGLIAVRAHVHRRGIARALLGRALSSLNRTGKAWATAEIDESNAAATALFEGIGAERSNSTLELMWR
ncbi:GNAT family N-acetyltransferase [Nocardia nova]|uniref:GNAT family N-acetyltransferase n=1 Tax=Nocardia nova TaxID=37330 RepID=A0A2S6AT44_9NOCA|nr:GNAT family N-acetyltransferase [Nocardia nova]PPJ26053.1 GNAT family N-acetyltransferase [Nocardia nova]PPJ38386.1 GNAT family N-acetyltransferase [Nocardia nova]